VGIVAVILSAIVFFRARLYSDALENLVYLAMQIYGWWYWLYGRKHLHEKTVPIRKLSTDGWIIWGMIIVCSSIGLGFFMDTFTNADFAYTDALTTVASLVAQWFVSRKIIDNWPIWIGVNTISTTIYFMKELYIFCGLYFIFLILAIKGLISWTRSKNKDRARTNGLTA
jgi:nicotinamide mononucleotide transporter